MKPLKHLLSVALIAATVLVASCGNSNTNTEATNDDTAIAKQPVVTAPEAAINKLHWLAGWWQQTMKEGILFEQWQVAANGTMTGKGGFIKGTDTMIIENLALEAYGDTVMYIPTVKKQNNGLPIPFVMTVAAGDSFVFENPAHDFPSRITYRRTSATSLVAAIYGNKNGKMKSETFEMNKVE
ncbi:MAG: DUF6265 family protein [Taibaiella sp.]|nr:DUF6265 family protein [Taibaiella sp.]